MKKTKATKKAEQKKTEQTAKVVEQRSAKKLIIFKVSISQFGGKVIDRYEAREAEKRNNADAGVADTRIILIPDSFKKPVTTAHGNLRAYIYRNSLCWDNDGWRAIPAEKYPKFEAEMNALVAEFMNEAKKLSDNVPVINEQNKTRMGNWNTKHVLPVDLMQYYHVDVQLGSDDGTAKLEGIEQNLASRIADDVAKRHAEKMQNCANELTERIVKMAQDVVERLGSKEVKGLKLSGMLDNIARTASAIESLNFTGNDALTNMVTKLAQMTASLTDKELKKNNQLRVAVKSEAERLVDELLKTPAKKQEEVKAEPRKIEVPDILKSALDTNTSIVAESNGDGTNEHNSKSVLDGLKI